MATVQKKNYSGMLEPPVEEIVETYVHCNFSQPAAITHPVTGKKVGVPIFPGSRVVTRREFFNCNLTNCDVPAGSTVSDCNTSITTQEVEEELIIVEGTPVSRIKKRLQVAHGRYVHVVNEDGSTTRTYEEFPQRG